ncbi:ankyrin repeat domain-containing protein [Coraliomargarita algicola]|uniref:Ankyrin repeat domain-containing protein n=1 Tax=Coraliomargarita algicola TaxID=3092156 RepID=A0ABZ0RPG0_9BACT|nr:ankyrin repeat domain-containing protein [Coraliomargarita sp. J2-16]WPJ97011.1 ankyrin repeat domain-containing protein [Coraliomargarita sp. J2-16]
MKRLHFLTIHLFFCFVASFAFGQTDSIFDSIKEGRLSEVVSFLSEGGDVNARSSSGTLLMQAARYQQVEIVNLLLSEGADVSLRGSSGFNVMEQLNSYINRSGVNRERMIKSLRRMGHSEDFIKKQSEQYVIAEFSGSDRDLERWTEIRDLIQNLKVDPTLSETSSKPPIAETSARAPVATVEAIEELPTVESEVKELTEIIPVEVSEETSEQSSNWWLWLVGLLVVVGGIGLVVRLKS